jgi:TolB protein
MSRRLARSALLVAVASSLVACATDVQRAAHCRGFPDHDIWVTDLEGNVSRLIDEPGADGFAAWSPDGTRIAFVASRDGNCEIYVMNADGSNQVNLTNSDSDELYPSWTRSGLLHNYPDWSPDGATIAFSGGNQPAGPESAHNIYLVDVDTGLEEQLTVQGEVLFGPKWSPDGGSLTYFDNDGPFTIWVVGSNGSGAMDVTEGGFNSWSPDGSMIVFDRGGDEEDVDLYVMSFDGEPRPLVDSPAFDTLPAWSPTGDLILFSSDR